MTKITKGKHDFGNQNVTKQKKKNYLLKWANLSLGGTNKNVASQIYETHLALEQHRIHIKKNHFKLSIKRLPKSCRIQNSNYIYKKNMFWYEKWMHKEKVSIL